jgi:predicted nucleic-acid-binding Zn-ribbon protein
MSKDRSVKCNKCGYIGNENEFPKGRDFFQKTYISKCPKCNNNQNPGDASMRMFSGAIHPFTYVNRTEPNEADLVGKVLFDADEAS